MFYSSYYKFIHNISFTCININSKHLKVLLADFLWYNFNKNKTEDEIINNNQAISEK